MASNVTEIYERIRIPPLYWNDSIKDMPDKPYKALIQDWVTNIKSKIAIGKGLYLYGEFGMGKSSSAAILLRAAAARGIFGLWVDFRHIAEYHIEGTRFDEQETYFQRMSNVPLLVIDEFEAKANKHYQIDVVENIVRIRRHANRPTIITSNQALTAFAAMQASKSEDEKKIFALVAGLLGVFPEALATVRVEGRNFRKDPVKR